MADSSLDLVLSRPEQRLLFAVFAEPHLARSAVERCGVPRMVAETVFGGLCLRRLVEQTEAGWRLDGRARALIQLGVTFDVGAPSFPLVLCGDAGARVVLALVRASGLPYDPGPVGGLSAFEVVETLRALQTSRLVTRTVSRGWQLVPKWSACVALGRGAAEADGLRARWGAAHV